MQKIKDVPGVCTILSDDPIQPDISSTYFCRACLSLAVNAEHSLISLISLDILLTMKYGLFCFVLFYFVIHKKRRGTSELHVLFGEDIPKDLQIVTCASASASVM